MAKDDDIELVLDVRFEFHPAAKKSAKGGWYKNKEHLEHAVDALVELPFFKDLKFAGPDDKLKSFKTPQELKSLVAIGRDEWTYVQSSDEDDRELRIVFQPTYDQLDLKIFISGRLLKKHSDTILDQYIAAAHGVRDALGDVAGMAVGYVWPDPGDGEPFKYPRPRPPRTHPEIPIYSVVDLVDLRFHKSKHPNAQPKEARALTAESPPKPAVRTEDDDFVALRWAKNATPSELRRAAGQRESWISEQIPMELEDGFNEQGDQIEKPGKGAKAKPPLTLYSEKYRTGYKAVVVFPDGAVEPHAWNQAKMVLKKKKLDDGSPVDDLMIVVPLREHVFTISEEAKKNGFAAVVYPSEDGYFWNPDPPGEWLGPPIGAEKSKPLKPRVKKSQSRAKS